MNKHEPSHERLEQAAIDELRRHGGSEHDIAQLREHFRKAQEDRNELDRSGIFSSSVAVDT